MNEAIKGATGDHLCSLSWLWEYGSLRRPTGSTTRLRPRLGEHTEEVLEESGLSAREIAVLKRAGVVAREQPVGQRPTIRPATSSRFPS